MLSTHTPSASLLAGFVSVRPTGPSAVKHSIYCSINGDIYVYIFCSIKALYHMIAICELLIFSQRLDAALAVYELKSYDISHGVAFSIIRLPVCVCVGCVL